MNGLEALDKLCQLACNDRDSLYYLQHKNCKEADENITFKPYCNGCPYCGGELKKFIEKELNAGTKYKKAFEIIKEKGLSLNELWLINNGTFKDYIEFMRKVYFGDETIEQKLYTKDEFDLLKEMLEWKKQNAK